MARYLTRDERLALQADDDGDPAETVVVNTGAKVTSYHDDPACSRVLADARTCSRRAA